jgi:hypothetical protein
MTREVEMKTTTLNVSIFESPCNDNYGWAPCCGASHIRLSVSSPDTNADRDNVYMADIGTSTPNKKKLAERFSRAVGAGVVFGEIEILCDINGKTYLSAKTFVSARTLNADLKRLGF